MFEREKREREKSWIYKAKMAYSISRIKNRQKEGREKKEKFILLWGGIP